MVLFYKILPHLLHWVVIPLCIFTFLTFYGKHRYTQGYEAARTAFAKTLEQASRAQQTQAHKAARQHEQQREGLSQQQRKQDGRIEQIIERPVYRRECFDNDGLRELNAAVAADVPAR